MPRVAIPARLTADEAHHLRREGVIGQGTVDADAADARDCCSLATQEIQKLSVEHQDASFGVVAASVCASVR
jgi:hypothetical protein